VVVLSSSITLSELDEGIEKSIENASRYLHDALFLFQNERYQSAILLSMLSFEESGKALSSLILTMDIEVPNNYEMRSHVMKEAGSQDC